MTAALGTINATYAGPARGIAFALYGVTFAAAWADRAAARRGHRRGRRLALGVRREPRRRAARVRGRHPAGPERRPATPRPAAPTSPAPSWSARASPRSRSRSCRASRSAWARRRAVRRVRDRAAREGPSQRAGDPRPGPDPRALVHARERGAADHRRRRVRPDVPAAARTAGGPGAVPDRGGLVGLPVPVFAVLAFPLVQTFAARSDERTAVVVGLVLEAVGLVGVALGDRQQAALLMIPGLAIYGLGVGAATAQLSALVLAEVPAARNGLASGISSAVRAARLDARRRRSSAWCSRPRWRGRADARRPAGADRVRRCAASGQERAVARAADALGERTCSPPRSWPPRSWSPARWRCGSSRARRRRYAAAPAAA